MDSSNHPRRPDHLRRRTTVAAAAGVAALAFPAAALAGTFTVSAHFPNHTPVANKKWPIVLDVSKGKSKLSGSVKYEFELGPMVVSHQPGHKFTGGVYKDNLTFPSDAVGQGLTLVVLVTTKDGTKSIDWAVTTKQ
jgi:hypothetical protein